MLKYLAHDTVNDIAIIQTSFAYNVRYGLQVKAYDNLDSALVSFRDCQRHALSYLLLDTEDRKAMA